MTDIVEEQQPMYQVQCRYCRNFTEELSPQRGLRNGTCTNCEVLYGSATQRDRGAADPYCECEDCRYNRGEMNALEAADYEAERRIPRCRECGNDDTFSFRVREERVGSVYAADSQGAEVLYIDQSDSECDYAEITEVTCDGCGVSYPDWDYA